MYFMQPPTRLNYKVEKELSPEVGDTHLIHLIRLVDSMKFSDFFKNFPILLIKIERILIDNLSEISTMNKCRILKNYSLASHNTAYHFNIVGILCRNLLEEIENFEEGDVINVLKSYEYFTQDTPFSRQLFDKLNSTVTTLAL